MKMIEDLNRLIRKKSLNTFIIFLLISLAFFALLVIYVTEHTQLMWMFIFICAGLLSSITIFLYSLMRMINPNALKYIERFCNATDDPRTTYMRLEETWTNGVLRDHKGNIIQCARANREYMIVATYIIGKIGVVITVIPLKNTVWIYYRLLKKNSTKLNFFFVEDSSYSRKKHIIKDVNMGVIETHIIHNCPDIVLDFSLEEIKYSRKLWDARDISGLRLHASERNNKQKSFYENGVTDLKDIFDTFFK